MQISVLFFGILRESFGESEALEVPELTTVADVLDHAESRSSGLEALWPRIAVAVNRQYVARDQALFEGDEVALLPPVSGGAHAD